MVSFWNILALACLCCVADVALSKNVVCYFSNWAQYRPGSGMMFAKNINPYYCSHVIFAFAQLSGNTIVPYEYNDDTSDGQWQMLRALKKTNPSLKTLLAVGGYSHGPIRFYSMASTSANRLQFINSAISLLRYFGFDGIDLDWEYPGDISASDKVYFTALIQEMRDAFEKEATLSGQPRLLMSAALPAGISKAAYGYNVTALDAYLDILNIMSYDYHGVWETYTGLASPMYSFDGLNVFDSVNWYVNNGARASKIHVGLSFFARTWTLSNPSNNYLGAYAIGGGTNGTYTRTAGILSYYEVCSLLRSGYTVQTDPIGQVKYAYMDNQWVTYEDRETLDVKLQWILSNNFGGAMVWALDMDDFTGQFCYQNSWPLMSLVSSKVLYAPDTPTASTTASLSTASTTTKPTPAPTSTSTSTSTTTKPTATTATPAPTPSTTTTKLASGSSTTVGGTGSSPQPKTFTCTVPNGFFADPASCNSYYVCQKYVPMLIRCPTDTLFNPQSLLCENKYTTRFICLL
ncbi:acidic mammalian chitinase-like [Physella acuta]|uniref:acidic mammalian chitinase-like n=1 Tax=Physella acuta TaxID=109671 RepID=UPI0027DCCE9A|nr:acidic mammalian chitinase-like [Physella acuta]